MAPAAPVRIALPTNVRPSHYDLEITPNLKDFTFTGWAAINIDIKEPTDTIKLNAKDLSVKKASLEIEGKEFQPATTESDTKQETITFKFAPPLAKGPAVFNLNFHGSINEKMNGFYRSAYKDAQGETQYMGVTQFEATSARCAFPCWDEPSAKATFTLHLKIDSKLTALSNQPVEYISAVEPEETTYHFEKTPIMSTYLVAWAIGDFEFVETTTTRLEKPVVCRVYTLPGLKEQGRFALEITPRILEYFAEIFGTAYPLPKLDQIAVPDFDAGAMENWGLITYRTVALLYDEKTSEASAKSQVASTVAHEIAHQWFGNLVTMEWWQDLWLNEGFATWVGTLAVDYLFPEWKTWSTFVVDDLQRGIRLDSLRSSHPIEVPVADAHEIHQIFDAISYQKGAAVIRMLSNWLTVDVFLAGIRRYLRKHAYSNATTNDLWAALSEESKVDVSEFMNTWTRVIGIPILEVTEANGLVTIEQHRFLTTNDVTPEDDQTVWWVPLGITPRPKAITDPNQTLKSRTISFEIPQEDGGAYLINKDYSGVFRVKYPAAALRRLGQAILEGSDKIGLSERAGLVADLGSLATSGHASTSNLLDLVQYYRNEEDYIVWNLIVSSVSNIATLFNDNARVSEGIKHFQRKLVDKQVQKLGWDFAENEDYLTSRLREAIIRSAARANHPATVAEAKRRFELFMSGSESGADGLDAILDPSVRQTAFEVALAHGGAAEFDRLIAYYNRTNKPDQQVMTLMALGLARGKAQWDKLFEFAMTPAVRAQDFPYVLIGLGLNDEARKPSWEWIKSVWPTLIVRYKDSLGMLGASIKIPLRLRTDQEAIEDAKKFFEDKDTESFQRDLDQVLETIKINVAYVAREQEGVSSWLGANGY